MKQRPKKSKEVVEQFVDANGTIENEVVDTITPLPLDKEQFLSNPMTYAVSNWPFMNTLDQDDGIIFVRAYVNKYGKEPEFVPIIHMNNSKIPIIHENAVCSDCLDIAIETFRKLKDIPFIRIYFILPWMNNKTGYIDAKVFLKTEDMVTNTNVKTKGAVLTFIMDNDEFIRTALMSPDFRNSLIVFADIHKQFAKAYNLVNFSIAVSDRLLNSSKELNKISDFIEAIKDKPAVDAFGFGDENTEVIVEKGPDGTITADEKTNNIWNISLDKLQSITLGVDSETWSIPELDYGAENFSQGYPFTFDDIAIYGITTSDYKDIPKDLALDFIEKYNCHQNSVMPEEINFFTTLFGMTINPNVHIVVFDIADTGKFMGYMIYTSYPNQPITVEHLYVAPEFRKHGVATFMMIKLLMDVSPTAPTTVEVNAKLTGEEFKQHHKFFEQFNFQPVSLTYSV